MLWCTNPLSLYVIQKREMEVPRGDLGWLEEWLTRRIKVGLIRWEHPHRGVLGLSA